jgi:hypothetical protein
MIPRSMQPISNAVSEMQNLSSGLPSVMGFAMLAAKAISQPDAEQPLSIEARILLRLARGRGVFELRGNPDSFDSSERLLAVCVERDNGQWVVFKQKGALRKTMAFLDGFRELCQSGLVMHQLAKEFSLTRAGFESFLEISDAEYEKGLEFAETVDF